MQPIKCHCIALTLLLGVTAAPARADIYSFVDSHGVRHITNQPNGDKRYKLVMKTPHYKKPAPPAETVATATASGNGWQLITPRTRWHQLTGKGWTLITPDGAAVGSISGADSAATPFQVNRANRRRYAPLVTRIAIRQGLDPHLVDAVISAESGYNPDAVSSAGAMGLMQLMPDTAQRFGVQNAFDPVANIRGGTRYLRWLLDKFGDNVVLALAGYNAGENAVIDHDFAVPPYAETRTYVSRVLQFYQAYRNGIDLSLNN